ncbi:MAG: leucyl/phenylalanyl-tRNA--protein transferase [Victivallales bacterium]|nr:leucyl/phenylalanyl-tRNA--protein transferase [Victivallales bacterium]
MPLKLPSIFANPEEADNVEGIVSFSYDLNAAMLQDAYSHGIFPWPLNDEIIPWVSPPERGVIPLEEFHIPRSFQRQLRKGQFELRVDTAFEAVIRGCATQERPGGGTWITPKIIRAYCELHETGWAHSFETWEKATGQLVGGLYGVSIGKIFSGESMFHTGTGASKFALVGTAEILKKCGVTILDTEMVTSTTALFGAREIPREQFLKWLEANRGNPLSTDELRRVMAR